jgi:ankyrin repeat protein
LKFILTGITPLQIAEQKGDQRIINLLNTAPSLDEALLELSRKSDLKAVEALLNCGANPNAKDRDGINICILRILISNPILGRTPLSLTRNESIKNLLISRGAYDILRWKSLINENKFKEMIRFLESITDKADVVNTADRTTTALHVASKKGSLQVVEYLLANGANVNRADGFGINIFIILVYDLILGWTPLHEASKNGHLEVVQVLLAAGATASVNRADRYGINI